MQLTTVSWVWFFIGIAMLVGVVAIWVWFFFVASESTRSDMRQGDWDIGLATLSVVLVIVGGLLAYNIYAGGSKAADIQHDLEQAGYEVGDISTDYHTAVIVVDGRALEVDLRKVNATPHNKWTPVVHCQVYTDGSIDDSLQDCATTQ